MGWPCLELRNVRSQWVGESERNVERVIQVTDNLAPAVLFFDEIDQLLGQPSTGASGDSGTSERILARIFSWLGSLSHRGRILFIGATNRPDILEPALRDRFGVSIPFPKPTAEELVEMVPMFLGRFSRSLAKVKVESVAELVAHVEPSGRDLQEILISAGHRADKQSGKLGTKIGRKHIEEAIHDHIQRESKSEMEFLTLVALSLASRQSLLPWNDLTGLRKEAIIPEWLVELGVVDLEGRLDQETLHKVIAQLRRQRYAEHAMR
jgi:SpoVK/Ycf46/Vps4 family AAA+-type ATPase